MEHLLKPFILPQKIKFWEIKTKSSAAAKRLHLLFPIRQIEIFFMPRLGNQVSIPIFSLLMKLGPPSSLVKSLHVFYSMFGKEVNSDYEMKSCIVFEIC